MKNTAGDERHEKVLGKTRQNRELGMQIARNTSAISLCSSAGSALFIFEWTSLLINFGEQYEFFGRKTRTASRGATLRWVIGKNVRGEVKARWERNCEEEMTLWICDYIICDSISEEDQKVVVVGRGTRDPVWGLRSPYIRIVYRSYWSTAIINILLHARINPTLVHKLCPRRCFLPSTNNFISFFLHPCFQLFSLFFFSNSRLF